MEVWKEVVMSFIGVDSLDHSSGYLWLAGRVAGGQR
jgi:hypothetical protein